MFLLAGCSEGTKNNSAAVSQADTTTSSVKTPKANKKANSKTDKHTDPTVTAASSSSTPDNSVGTDESADNTDTSSQQSTTAGNEQSQQTTSTSTPATTSSSEEQSSGVASASTSSEKAEADSASESTVPVAAYYGKWVGADGFTIYYNASGNMVISQQGSTTMSPVVAEQMSDGRVLFRATKPGIDNILAKIGSDGKMYLTMAGYDSLALTKDAGWDGQLPE
ncbi:hypothetical protein L248_1554 [Schleiferilactobacillus shenzhenensis LY-73]|uniref:Uncharacterized protein n=1 Tax=Schleiferilactobacillus shenzhenensis LY-73 TaxID=1231336 RepID=U4TRI0_9LACO|nr:hypothetical protein L248_1554 [Schleiferilactobacillus shenzhenensis LY-73]